MESKRVLVCAPSMADSVEKMVSDMHLAKAQGADVVELRLDCLKNFLPRHDLPTLLTNKPLPVIVVYRPKCEGGEYERNEKERVESLRMAYQLGADYVDIEYKVAPDFVEELKREHPNHGNIIVSHFSGSTPSKENLTKLAAELQSTRADIIRLISTANDITELDRIFYLLSHSQVPVIAYSEGVRGFISQLVCTKYGGFLVYGSLEGDSLPGLPTLDSIKEVYKVERVRSDTKVFGLISKPVSHSKGPILHNSTFRHIKFNGLYVPMFVDDLKEFFSVYTSPDYAGYSVGFPYKEAITELCDEVHPLAKAIGAVNTIIRQPTDGKLIGYNTDCEASITAIEDAIKYQGTTNSGTDSDSPIAGKQFVVVGAGGAGRALAFGALIREAKIVHLGESVNDKNTKRLFFQPLLAFEPKERAKSLAKAVSGEARPFADLFHLRPEHGAILANATPLGMHPNTDRIPVPEDTLGMYRVVFDAVYIPRRTRLLKEAEAAGAITVSGVEMFIRQAIGQFNLFTGEQAPEDFMREIVIAKF